MQLTEKETLLVKDLIAAEKLSIEKYAIGSSEAKGGGLKNLFSEVRAVEQAHLETLQAIQAGQSPTGSGNAPQPQVPASVAYSDEQEKKADQYLCQDALSSEKQISGMYETSVFEFAQPELRKALNKMQSEEQAHGEFFYAYMSKAGMAC
ncbi:MAG: hypothetical protein GXW99_06035 [Clostridiales bacterium]|nr:hypothetical protein [Clostridiales bacterium]